MSFVEEYEVEVCESEVLEDRMILIEEENLGNLQRENYNEDKHYQRRDETLSVERFLLLGIELRSDNLKYC